MVNYREILRLHSLNYSQREIAASVHSSRSTIQQVLSLAAEYSGVAEPPNLMIESYSFCYAEPVLQSWEPPRKSGALQDLVY